MQKQKQNKTSEKILRKLFPKKLEPNADFKAKLKDSMLKTYKGQSYNFFSFKNFSILSIAGGSIFVLALVVLVVAKYVVPTTIFQNGTATNENKKFTDKINIASLGNIQKIALSSAELLPRVNAVNSETLYEKTTFSPINIFKTASGPSYSDVIDSLDNTRGTTYSITTIAETGPKFEQCLSLFDSEITKGQKEEIHFFDASNKEKSSKITFRSDENTVEYMLSVDFADEIATSDSTTKEIKTEYKGGQFAAKYFSITAKDLSGANENLFEETNSQIKVIGSKKIGETEFLILQTIKEINCSDSQEPAINSPETTPPTTTEGQTETATIPDTTQSKIIRNIIIDPQTYKITQQEVFLNSESVENLIFASKTEFKKEIMSEQDATSLTKFGLTSVNIFDTTTSEFLKNTSKVISQNLIKNSILLVIPKNAKTREITSLSSTLPALTAAIDFSKNHDFYANDDEAILIMDNILQKQSNANISRKDSITYTVKTDIYEPLTIGVFENKTSAEESIQDSKLLNKNEVKLKVNGEIVLGTKYSIPPSFIVQKAEDQKTVMVLFEYENKAYRISGKEEYFSSVMELETLNQEQTNLLIQKFFEVDPYRLSDFVGESAYMSY